MVMVGMPIQQESSHKLKSISLSVLLLFFGLALGFIACLFFPSKPQPVLQPQCPKQQITEADLPIGTSLFKNPIVYEWRGSVEGTLSTKDEYSIFIKDDKGNSLRIPTGATSSKAGMTVFYDLKFKEIPLSDLPIGSYLRGDFFVSQRNKEDIVGSSFQIVK